MEQDWSNEPWTVGCNGTLSSEDGTLIVAGGGPMNDLYRAEACVNACADIPTEDLEDIIAIGKRELEKCKTLGRKWRETLNGHV